MLIKDILMLISPSVHKRIVITERLLLLKPFLKFFYEVLGATEWLIWLKFWWQMYRIDTVSLSLWSAVYRLMSWANVSQCYTCKTGSSVKITAASKMLNLIPGLWNPEPSRTIMWLIIRQWFVCISLYASVSSPWANLMPIDVFWKFWSLPAWINFSSCQSIMTQLLRRRWFDWQQED